jgi:membrane-bound ClpP family serine protease
VGFVPKHLIGAGAVLAAVGLVLGAQGSTALGLTGVALVLAGLYLIAFGVWSFKRGVLGALTAATVLAGILLLTTPAMRRILIGTESQDDQGWVADTLVPWLRERWWALLVVLAIIIVLPALASYLSRRFTLKR